MTGPTMSDKTSHIAEGRMWLESQENLIRAEECKRECTQTIERCHEHQIKYGPCVFECKYRLNELDEPDYWRSKYQANKAYNPMEIAKRNAESKTT